MFKFPDTINKLRKAISNSGFDGFLVTNDYNRRYISGFSGSAGYLLITKKYSILITDFRYILSLRGELTDDCGVLQIRAIPPIQLDDEVNNQDDPFNKNVNHNPGYTQENDGTSDLVLFVSTTAPQNLILKYLKTPVDVLNDINTPANNVDCELAESSHEEIVNIAVRKMLGTVQDQLQYQIQSKEAQIQ